MNTYKINIDIDAFNDIKEITNWYNNQLKGLGSQFKKQTKFQINSLKNNPLGFAIRYKNYRCLLIKKFPFLIHFNVEESNKVVNIYAIFHTSRNPEIWIT